MAARSAHDRFSLVLGSERGHSPLGQALRGVDRGDLATALATLKGGALTQDERVGVAARVAERLTERELERSAEGARRGLAALHLTPATAQLAVIDDYEATVHLWPGGSRTPEHPRHDPPKVKPACADGRALTAWRRAPRGVFAQALAGTGSVRMCGRCAELAAADAPALLTQTASYEVFDDPEDRALLRDAFAEDLQARLLAGENAEAAVSAAWQRALVAAAGRCAARGATVVRRWLPADRFRGLQADVRAAKAAGRLPRRANPQLASLLTERQWCELLRPYVLGACLDDRLLPSAAAASDRRAGLYAQLLVGHVEQALTAVIAGGRPVAVDEDALAQLAADRAPF